MAQEHAKRMEGGRATEEYILPELLVCLAEFMEWDGKPAKRLHPDLLRHIRNALRSVYPHLREEGAS